MEQIFVELGKLGLAGIVAFITYRMYLDEKKAHEETRHQLYAALEARITDSKENTLKITEPLAIMSQGIKDITAKIESSRERQ